jgi:hypothetical protein
MKNFFKFIAAFILGLLFSGGLDMDDIKFQRNIRKLKKEKWFKDMSDNGRYYESIYHNQELKNYLITNGITDKIINNKEERERFLSFIKIDF